jgi:dethiobiotin synthetase
VAAFKPVVTGTDDVPEPGWPPDDELLAAAAGVEADDVVVRRYAPPVSPHLAADLAGEPAVPLDDLVAAARRAGAAADALVVEGVGGLLVPLSWEASIRDLAAQLALPLVVAARTGLGTINHTLLTLEAARSAGLSVAAVVMGPWPPEPTAMEASNRETVERLGGVPVFGLPHAASGAPADLVAAVAGLPVESWLGDAAAPGAS